MTSKKAVVLFFLWGLFLSIQAKPAYAFQAGGDEKNPFVVFYDEGPIEVAPGAVYPFEILFQIPENFYLYAEQLEVELKDSPLFAPLKPIRPEAVMKEDPFFGRVLPVYCHEVMLKVPLRISERSWEGLPHQPKGGQGTIILSGEIRLQGCSAKLCYPLQHIPLHAALIVQRSLHPQTSNGGASDQETDAGKRTLSLSQLLKARDFGNVAKEGFLIALLVSFIGGLLTDFTPCVWPMIPVTLVLIGVRKEMTPLANLKVVFFLICGMAVMYSLLGVLAAALGKSLGFLFQNIAFLIFLDLLLLAMALSLFGLFEMRLPASWQLKLSQISSAGPWGIFIVGLTMGLLAAPCVGPVVGPLLVYVAQSKSLIAGFVLLFSYAIGMGSLFVILGVASGSLLPMLRGGPWMVWLKRGLGFLVLLVSIYYAHAIYSQVFEDDAGDDGFWISSLGEGLARARGEGRPVVIDFFAHWCPPCLELDRRVWDAPRVRERIKDSWIPIKIDCTRETKSCQEAVLAYDVIGWPTVIFLDRQQREESDARLVGVVVDADEVLRIMEKVEGLRDGD